MILSDMLAHLGVCFTYLDILSAVLPDMIRLAATAAVHANTAAFDSSLYLALSDVSLPFFAIPRRCTRSLTGQ